MNTCLKCNAVLAMLCIFARACKMERNISVRWCYVPAFMFSSISIFQYEIKRNVRLDNISNENVNIKNVLRKINNDLEY